MELQSPGISGTRPFSCRESERFEALAVPLMPQLLGTARQLTRDAANAEDLLQETYLRAFRSFDSFSPGTNIRAWLYTILRRTHVDLLRRRGRSPWTVALDENQFVGRSPGTGIFAEDGLARGLSSVPEPFRAALVLRGVHELSYGEIASKLGVPLGTVMSRLHRGRVLLRDVLQDERGRAASDRA